MMTIIKLYTIINDINIKAHYLHDVIKQPDVYNYKSLLCPPQAQSSEYVLIPKRAVFCKLEMLKLQ